MMRSPRSSLLTAILLTALVSPPAFAGGALESLDITGREPSIVPGQVIARLVPIRWDPRCIPVLFRFNDTLDPIPNPLGPDFLTLTEATAVMETSLGTWNEIPTSFIDMRLAGATGNPGPRRYDTVHEITFRTPPDFDPTLIASSVSCTLMEDTELTDGTDLDEDGDSDVTAGIETCRDVDGDGDLELPAGFYRAGTILDSDVQFNTRPDGFRFTAADEDVDTDPRSVDLEAVATHEFGHSHGLAHTLTSQIGRRDGTQATMFPFLDTGDPADQLAVRHLEVEDVATSSHLYPEGSAESGPGALQWGDVAFHRVFGLIEGEAFDSDLGLPLGGASVFAVDALSGEVEGSTLTGSLRRSFRLSDGSLFTFRRRPDFHLADGRYVLPVPFGVYRVGMEAVDGAPVGDDIINQTTFVAAFLGQADFPEELFNAKGESAVEVRPGSASPVFVLPFGAASRGIDLISNQVTRVFDFDPLPPELIDFREAPPGTHLAVEFPAEQIQLASGGRDFALVAALFRTVLADRSAVPIFARALLTTGTVAGDGTAVIDLGSPLARVDDFAGQDNDDSPLYFPFPRLLGKIVRHGIESGEFESLFLVLEGPREPLPGPNLRGPFLGADAQPPLAGRSFVSTDGITFVRDEGADLLFQLVLSELGGW